MISATHTSRATVTIDLAAIADNVSLLRRAAGSAELWAVVKADGYGHGASVVGRAALAAGAAKLCVATWEEARALRADLPDAPVLVMSPLTPGEESEVSGVEVAVSSVEGLERLRAAAREPLIVHVKADTGMGRWGMSPAEALRAGDELVAGGGRLRLGGLMSHLASADNDPGHTRLQLGRFAAIAERFPSCPRHIANSAATLTAVGAAWDAVRCGIAVYGLSPFQDEPAEHGLRPALRFETYVAQLKLLEPGESAGYGRRFVADSPTWIGLAPAGYADGVPRMMSGKMDVLVRRRRRRVAATISMDQLIFVIGESCDVEVGDTVVLIGADGDERVGAEEWAALSDTISYEILTDIAPRRRRVEHVVVGGWRLAELRAQAPVEGAWLVGGSVRDLLLGRPVLDIDLVVDADPAPVARRLAGAVGGSPFPLSERHGAWRVVGDGRVIDVTRSRGALEHDLRLRDFTINAIAIPLAGGDPIDPSGGRADLDSGVVRAVSDAVFDDDPLRLLRLPRIAHELGFEIEVGTARLAADRAGRAAEPSSERIFMEMRRMMGGDRPAEALRLTDRLGVLDVVLPEVTPLRGCLQSAHHQLDVWEHTLHVIEAVADIGDHPAHYLPAHADRVRAELDEPVGDEMTARQALRLAALFHDIRKPQTRREVDGRIGFMGHDAEGAAAAAAILGRWKASNDLIRFCRALVREHLALGFSIPSRPLGLRVAHRYQRATAPWPASSVTLSLADRLATRGPSSRLRHLRRHSETADEMLSLLGELERERRPPLLRGDEIADQTGAAGAEIGRLVDVLAEEQAAGAVSTREEALALVREQVRQDG